MPITIYRRMLGEFLVYTKEEADDLGMKYQPWHEAKGGEYALSDDNYVAIVRDVKSYKMKTGVNTEIKLPYGRFWIKHFDNGKVHLGNGCKFEEKHKTRSYNFAAPITYGEFYARNKKMKLMIKVAARMLLEDGKIDYEYLGKRFKPNDLLPALSIKKILKHKEVRAKMEDEVVKTLSRYGVNDEMVIRRCFIQAIEIAEKNKDSDTLLKAGIELAKLKNMYPQKRVVTNEFQVSRNTEYLDTVISREENKMVIHQTQELKQ